MSCSVGYWNVNLNHENKLQAKDAASKWKILQDDYLMPSIEGRPRKFKQNDESSDEVDEIAPFEESDWTSSELKIMVHCFSLFVTTF